MITERTAWTILIAGFFSVAAAQIVLKSRFTTLGLAGDQRLMVFDTARRILLDPLIWAGAILVVLGAASWYLSMTKLPLSVIMPLSSVVAPLVAMGAHVFLGEPLGLGKLGAIIVIALGAAWLTLQ